MRLLRNHWYYWYTGEPLIAFLSIIVTAALLWGGLVWWHNYSVWGVLLALLLDSAGFWFALIYTVALRFYLPDMLVEQVDTWLLQNIFIPLCVSFVINRLVTFGIAKAVHAAPKPFLYAAWGLVAITFISASIFAYRYYEEQKAAAAAERQRMAELKAKAEALKHEAGQLIQNAATGAKQAIDSATKTANDLSQQAAEGTKQAIDATAKTAAEASAKADQLSEEAKQKAAVLSEEAKQQADKLGQGAKAMANETADKAKAAWSATCRKTAETFGQKPEDYCKE